MSLGVKQERTDQNFSDSVIVYGKKVLGEMVAYPILLDEDGNVLVSTIGAKAPDANIFNAILDNADTTTAREIQASESGAKIYITSFCISVDTAGNYWLQDEDDTQVTGKFYLAANGGVVMNFPPETPLKLVTAKALEVKGSVSGNVSVTVSGYIV